MRAKHLEVVDEDVNQARAYQHPDDEIRDERVELLLRQHAGTPANPRQCQSITDEVPHEVHHSVPAQLERTERDNVRRDSRIRECHSRLLLLQY